MNSLEDMSLISPQHNPPSKGELATDSVLLQLSDQSNAAFEMPSLSLSLSSLSMSDTVNTEATPVSLSDLIAQSNRHLNNNQHNLILSPTVPLIEANKGIDLSVLINSPEKSENGHVNQKCLSAELREPENYPKKYSNSKQMHVSKGFKKCTSRARILKARPSAFALTLCFTYIPKTFKKEIIMSHQYPHNNMFELTRETNNPALVPFDFQTPSPDDIVKENQKKAFGR
ncbi:hypothetical protein XELAEV_18027104mg [Xenopus laevis]|nr:hypothetical protein XELAEV_18027104mg [Xenopus laevis]